mgnify:CR=1 FL=1|jgi:hypothetical protein
MKKTIEVVKTPFTIYRVSINGEETYDVLTQDPHDIGSAIMIRESESGYEVPYEKWDEIERMVSENY